MRSPAVPALLSDLPASEPQGTSRRRFLSYLVAAPTLAVAVRYAGPASAEPIITPPGPADVLDLGDILILGAKDTESLLIVLEVKADGTVHCALPREEVGQGITTAVAMLIADELDVPLRRVRVTLADARPELMRGQLTGASNTIRAVYEPVRQAAATARARMTAAAASQLGVPAGSLSVVDGAVQAPDGSVLDFAALTGPAADPDLEVAAAAVKAAADLTLVGRPTNRVDARKMVTGQLKYTLDLDPRPGAARAMVRRPPTLNGTVKSIDNRSAVRAMPGVLGLYVIPTGVAVLAETFGQALDAKEALKVPGTPGRSTARTTPRSSASSRRRRPRCRPHRPAPRSSTASSRSPRPATLRWSPTARSPTFGPAAARSGRA